MVRYLGESGTSADILYSRVEYVFPLLSMAVIL